jgi:hypothetical protein
LAVPLEVTETTLTEPDAVEAIATSIADAVVIDVVAPPVLPDLVATLGGYTLLRPLFEHIRTSHGERQPVFVGYAALTSEDGLWSPSPTERWRFRTDRRDASPLARDLAGAKVVASLAVGAGDDEEEEPFDGAVHLDRYVVEEQIQRLAESAGAARSTWEELRRSARPARWEGEDDLFDPGLADDLDTLVFEVMQTAEIAWKLLDDANLDGMKERSAAPA